MKGILKQNVVVFFASFVPAVLTYIFWIIAANLTNSWIVGTIAAIGSIAMILGSISQFDIDIGMKRFLGIAIADKKYLEFKQIVAATTLFGFTKSGRIFLLT